MNRAARRAVARGAPRRRGGLTPGTPLHDIRYSVHALPGAVELHIPDGRHTFRLRLTCDGAAQLADRLLVARAESTPAPAVTT